MTSKTLFRNLLKDDIKKKRGLFVVALFCFVFVNPISALMFAERLLTSEEIISMANIRATCIAQISFANWGNCVLPIILSVILAITEFSFIFSKRRIDLYHSLPVKRKTLFFSRYISGYSIFTVIMLISTLLNIAAMGIKGFMGTDVWTTAGRALLLAILYFTLFYNLSIVAVLLTGNFWISLCSIGILIFYIPIVKEIIDGFFSNYMSTYYMRYDSLYSPSILLSIISPVISIFYVTGTNPHKWIIILAAILLALLLLGLAIWLYKKRPSEASGHALSFTNIEVFLHFLIIVPSAMLGGYYVVSLFSNLSVFWFWFTFVSAGILCHCILEVLLHFDIKAVFNHKLQLLIAMVAAAIITFAFQFDWFGYDHFLPDEKKIEYTSVCFENIDMDINSYNIDNSNSSYNIYYSNKDSAILKEMKLTNTEDVLALAKKGIEHENSYPDTPDNYEALGLVAYNRTRYDESVSSKLNFVIRYHMKSGKDVYRNYYVEIKDCVDELSRIYNCAEYKETAYQIDNLYEAGIFKQINAYNIWDDKVLSVAGNELNEFINAYITDLNSLTIETLQKETPIMRLESICDTNLVDSCDADLYGYYIYPSFTNTLNFMKQYGVSDSSYENQINPEKIVSIHPFAYYDDFKTYEDLTYNADNNMDKKKITELGKSLILDTYISSNQLLYPYNNNFSFELQYILDNGIKINTYAVLPGDEIPDFLYEDLELKEE